MTDFTMLGLPEPLLRALEADNFKTPTEIQNRSIPVLMDGNDFIGLAQIFLMPRQNASLVNHGP